MGEMQMFTCQWVRLGPAPRGGEGEWCPPPQGSQGTRLHGGGAGFSEGGSVKSSRRKGILFRRKKGFRAGQCWGEQCRLWSRGGGGEGWGRRPPGRAGAGRSLHLRRYRKFTEMRVMESFIAYSQGSSSFDKIILVPELPLALSVRALPFMTSSQLPFWSVTRPRCFFHSSAFSLFFFTSIQSAHYCQTIVSKISLGLCHLPAQKPFSAFYCHWSSMDTSPCRKPSTMRCQQFTSKTTRSSHQSGSITDLSLDVTPFLETFF